MYPEFIFRVQSFAMQIKWNTCKGFPSSLQRHQWRMILMSQFFFSESQTLMNHSEFLKGLDHFQIKMSL